MRNEHQSSSDRLADLRRRAEDALLQQPEELAKLPAADVQRLIHELQVHQLELELQNEELLRTQQELELSRDRYFELYDLAPVAYLSLSDDGSILEANLACGTMLGVERARLVDQPLTRFIARGDQDNFYLFHRQLLRTKTRQVREFSMARWEGSQFDALLEVVVGEVSVGEAPVCRATITDITVRKRAEAALHEYSQRLARMVEEQSRDLKDSREELARRDSAAVLSRLSRTVGHELRDPLPVINLATDYLEKALDGTDFADVRVKERLRLISAEIHNLETVVLNLLDLARVRPAEKQQIAIADVAREALARSPAPRNVRVSVDMPPNLPMVFADPDQVGRVLTRLITNAYRAMPEGGDLKISAAADVDQVHLSVTDTGRSIPVDNLDQLFEPVFTAEAQGLVLGLALARSLVEANGGNLEVGSRQGEGSTFTATLPASGGGS
jgi:PAS domain S-box-containing protein